MAQKDTTKTDEVLPEKAIEKENEKIIAASDSIVIATKNIYTAAEAIEYADDVLKRLSSRKKVFVNARHKRISESLSCTKFGERFEELLDLLSELSNTTTREEIETINNLVDVLNGTDVDTVCNP